jgi:hypothetical protein
MTESLAALNGIIAPTAAPRREADILAQLLLGRFHHLKDKKGHYPFCVIHDYLSRFFPDLYLYYRKLWEGQLHGCRHSYHIYLFLRSILINNLGGMRFTPKAFFTLVHR